MKNKNQYTDNMEERARRFVKDNYKEWEYITGAIGSDGYFKLKHLQCGQVINKSAVTIRHKRNIICSYCIEKKKENKILEKEKEKIKAERERLLKREYKQETFKTCCECGALFLSSNKKYCSEACAKKRSNANSKDKRIKNIKHLMIDKDISIEKLFVKEQGVCYLCNGLCEKPKGLGGTTDSNGNYYPSIEHIKPLSKGGLHSWDNVRLAHRICNSMKGSA